MMTISIILLIMLHSPPPPPQALKDCLRAAMELAAADAAAAHSSPAAAAAGFSHDLVPCYRAAAARCGPLLPVPSPPTRGASSESPRAPPRREPGLSLPTKPPPVGRDRPGRAARTRRGRSRRATACV